MNTTLKQAKENHLKKRIQKESAECFNICKTILEATTYPEIQQSVFEKYFLQQFKTLLNDGVDPYLDEKEERSISNMWVLTAGSLNTPVVVVNGEGPDKITLGTLPPFCTPMYLKSSDKKINTNTIEDALEYKTHDTLTYMTKLEQGISEMTKDIKETKLKPNDHKENWLKAIENIENKISEMKKTNTKSSKKEKDNTGDQGVSFEW